MAEGQFNLCELNEGTKVRPTCRRKPRGQVQSYQQQILSQAKNLGQLMRHYVVRKCFEDRIDERKALEEISRYRSCYPNCSEMQLLQALLRSKACPDTIIYQTYIVEAEKGRCCGAEQTFQKLKQRPPALPPKRIIRPCCDEDHPVGSGPKHTGTPQPGRSQQARPSTVIRRPPGVQRPQSMYKGPPYPTRTPRQSERGTPCAPQKSPSRASPYPGPCPQPPANVTPCQRTPLPCPTSQRGQPAQASTPLEEGGVAYFGSPEETPAFLCTPGQTPVTKRKTRIPVAIRQDLSKSQKRQARDTTGSRIPCPISTQVPRSARFSRVQISFGGTQVSYFEDTLPSLVGQSQLEESLAVPLSPALLPQQPEQFKEYKTMIDQEKKEIREMHNVVTQLMDRPAKVEFRDMYSLVPQISYIDESLTDPAPEVTAAMLHSDELGLSMKSTPTEVYNTLFKGGDRDKTLINVAPEENAQSVAPLNSEGFEATLIGIELEGLFQKVSPESEYDLPEMPNVKSQDDKESYEEGFDTTLKEDIQPREGTPQRPGEGADQSTIKDESQEPSAAQRLSTIQSRGSRESNEEVFNVQLQVDMGSNNDFVQIRGSQPPSWFPGYFVAMGDSPKINVAQKPWEILEKAWRKFEPSKMKPDNGTYVLGI